MKKAWLFLPMMLILLAANVSAQQTEAGEQKIAPYVETVQKASEGMTLWEILRSGGLVMIGHSVLSIFMLSLVLYLSIRLNAKRLLPQHHTDRIVAYMRQRQYEQAKAHCLASDNLVSSIALAGLNNAEHGVQAAQDAVELQARKEIAGFWSALSYLSDIAQIAPMLGLLGTVLGMIQAFNTIAFDAGVVKPVLLAGGVSKAMITTAAGLVVAIVSMTFYSMLRVKVLKISNTMESTASRIMEGLSR